GGMTIDAAVSRTLNAFSSYTLDVSLKGSTISVSIDGAAALGFVYNAPLVDGQAGIFAKGTAAQFDSYQLKTDDGSAGANISAPTAANDSVSGTEDTPFVITETQLLANDTDPNGLLLSVTGVSQPANGTLTATTGGWTFTPNANWNGTTSFTYSITNTEGGVATGNVTITVAPVNDAPVAGDDSVSANQDTPVNITAAQLLANDSDLDGDTLSITAVTQPSNGTLVAIAGGWTFTPTAGFYGTTTFTYTASDGKGGTAMGTVSINVAKANNAPVANADSVTTAEDTPVAITRAQLVNNDVDPDGDTLTVTGVSALSSGTLTANAEGWLFTPAANFHGTVTFTYTLSDGNGGTATATVTITVTPVNDAPVAGNDAFSTNQNSPLAIPYALVLANDSDVDGDALSIAGFSLPANGTLTQGADGWTFTPNAGFFGNTSFTYTVSDGKGGTAIGTVSITVNPATTSATYNGAGGSIKDFGTTTFNLSVADAHLLLSLTVQVNITHPAKSELTVTLIAPDGTRVLLTVAANGSATGNLGILAGKSLNGLWKLEIKDGKKKNTGTLNSWSITATWGAALHAADAASADIAAASVSSFDVSSTARTVLDLWSTSGALSADQFARLQSVEFEIVDLPGSMLGFATWEKISIDVNAAGFGWFVDAAPSFDTSLGSTAVIGMDLLSVIGHELGHLLGEIHSDGLMGEMLDAGMRTFSLSDSDHATGHSTGTGDSFNVADVSSTLRRLDSLSFDGWIGGSNSLGSGLTLNTGVSLLGSFRSLGFGRVSGFSIFDEDGDEALG
ncbi:MAG TPA: cadherin-like domain-containing protein, partial [Opitutaceae bacterium]|nr:cadherin-like domain-containing protein [Opitutaceae bacterium]